MLILKHCPATKKLWLFDNYNIYIYIRIQECALAHSSLLGSILYKIRQPIDYSLIKTTLCREFSSPTSRKLELSNCQTWRNTYKGDIKFYDFYYKSHCFSQYHLRLTF